MKGQMEIFIILAVTICLLFIGYGFFKQDISFNLLSAIFGGILLIALMMGA